MLFFAKFLGKTNMKTIKIKIKIGLKLKNEDFIFNSTIVKADIFWVKEKNKVY